MIGKIQSQVSLWNLMCINCIILCHQQIHFTCIKLQTCSLFLFLDFYLPFLTLSIRRQWRWWRHLCFAWTCWPCAVSLPRGFLLFLGHVSCVRAGDYRVHSRHKKQHWKTKPSRFSHLKRHVRTTKVQDSRCKPDHLQSGSIRHLIFKQTSPRQTCRHVHARKHMLVFSNSCWGNTLWCQTLC